MESNKNEKPVGEPKVETNEENDEDDGFTEEEQQEIMQEISKQEALENELNLQVKQESPKGSALYQRYSQLQQQFPIA